MECLLGKNGLVGNALQKQLSNKGKDFVATGSSDLNLLDRESVFLFFQKHRPKTVYFSAARTGGLFANQSAPLEFLKDNVQMQFNVFEAAHSYSVEQMIFFASSTVYSDSCTQPYTEADLYKGKLHSSIASYAYSKLMGIHTAKLYCDMKRTDIRTVIPCNLYGTGDKFETGNMHVIPALIDKFINAKFHGLSSISLHGSGDAQREFLFADDLAEFLVQKLSYLPKQQWRIHCEHSENCLNLGAKEELSIRELAKIIAEEVGFQGVINFDIDTNDGAMRKKLDSSLARRFGWNPQTSIRLGVRKVIKERIKDINK